MTTVREILAEWLREHGYDGLWYDKTTDTDCSCGVDDLCPCGGPEAGHCLAAVAVARRDGSGIDLRPGEPHPVDGSDRSVPFDPQAFCDRCGAKGAFDFMGDNYCPECAGKMTK